MVDNELKKLLDEVLKSRKYKNLSTDIVIDIGRREILKRKRLKEAVKHTKNKLHQVGGSYFKKKIDYSSYLEKLAENKNDIELIKSLCLEIMSHHASTVERINFLKDFYELIFSSLPPVNSIIDLGCGLNPLSIFWMPLKGSVTYYAFDIYEDMIGFLNDFMALADIKGYAEPVNLVRAVPQEKGDVAFIFKLLPVLEQIDRTSSLNLMEKINAENMVVTFPSLSLCGKNKNMTENYEKKFRELISMKSWNIKRLDFKEELIFIVSR